MNRKETTKLLTDILIQDKLSDRKYFAKEVTLDYTTPHEKRVDVMQFIPKGVIHASDIEKGIFICYEVKSCWKDVYSGNGLNFFGEKNYIVTTMATYKQLINDYNNNVITRYLDSHHPESLHNFGFMVPIPKHIDLKDANAIYQEFENPTEFKGKSSDWRLWTPIVCHEGHRNKSTTELLFCMLRSKHSYTNQV